MTIRSDSKGRIGVAEALVQGGAYPSKREARLAIRAGKVRVNGEAVTYCRSIVVNGDEIEAGVRLSIGPKEGR